MRLSRLVTTVLLAAFLSTGANAVELKMVSSAALEPALRSFADSYAKKTGNTVSFVFSNPADLEKNIAENHPDIVAGATSAIADLKTSGKVVSGPAMPLARVGLGVIVREGYPKPDISTPEAFKKAVMSAPRVFYNNIDLPNSSGAVTAKILAKAGILKPFLARGKQLGTRDGKIALQKGETDLGFANISEADGPGVVYVGPVPAALQDYLTYVGTVLDNAPSKREAEDFLRLVTAKDAAPVWASAKLEQMARQ
jgi:molybdate transport system substrate-binding protein